MLLVGDLPDDEVGLRSAGIKVDTPDGARLDAYITRAELATWIGADERYGIRYRSVCPRRSGPAVSPLLAHLPPILNEIGRSPSRPVHPRLPAA